MWDLLGQPSQKFNYKVKYSAPSITHVFSENIVPLRWGEEFGEKDWIVRIVNPSNLQVMGIDI